MNTTEQVARILANSNDKKSTESDLTALIAAIRTEERARALKIVRQCATGVGKQFEHAEAAIR